MEQLLDPRLIALGFMLAPVGSMAGDYAKANFPRLPRYGPSTIAFATALAVVCLVNIYQRVPFSADVLAGNILASLYAVAVSVAGHETQKMAQRKGK